MGASPYVVNILKHGLTLEFLDDPPLSSRPVFLDSYKGDRIRSAALQQAVEELSIKQVIEPVMDLSSPGFYGRLFLRPKPGGRWRTIVDLSQLNTYIKNDSFRMESSISIQESMRPGMWATSVDLVDAYFHVPIHKSYRRFMRVALFGKVWQFRAMPMGLNVSARIFTKIIVELLKVVRCWGVHIRAYIDDWILKAWRAEKLRHQTLRVVRLCIKVGLMVNIPKSDLDPLQAITFVGTDFKLKEGYCYAPVERLQEIETLIAKIICRWGATARMWTSLLGMLGSVMRQIQLGPLHRRPIQWFLQTRWHQSNGRWDSWIALEEELIVDLLWWTKRENTRRGVSLEPFSPEITLFTDASKQGYGATLGQLEVKGVWNEKQRNMHSNNREMLAVLKGVTKFWREIQNKRLLICTDNTTTMATINKQGGTRSWQLTSFARTLWLMLDKLNCTAKARHIAGKLNVTADYLSRPKEVIATEWSMHPQALRPVWERWGTPNIDLFATRKNHKLPTYVSPLPDPQAWAVDAMTLSWRGLYAYAFPPWAILDQVLMKIQEDEAEVILIAPDWKGHAWYPSLLEMKTEEPIMLHKMKNLLTQAHSGKMHNNLEMLSLHAWRLSGGLCKERDSLGK